jgi:hypothetical protein
LRQYFDGAVGRNLTKAEGVGWSTVDLKKEELKGVKLYIS